MHKSWWDTVDALAAHPVGTLVMRYPELGAVMDRWIDDDNIWVARTAILHQLRYKDAINEARLFSYVEKRAADTEFFIRKALGWALPMQFETSSTLTRKHSQDSPNAKRSSTCR